MLFLQFSPSRVFKQPSCFQISQASAGCTTDILCPGKLQTCCLAAQSFTVDPVSLLPVKKKSLWGQMPERLCYSLDSYHSNQGAWQLMFHLQINYSELLMEENVSSLSFFFFFLPCSEISFWCICVTLSHTFFSKLWFETHMEQKLLFKYLWDYITKVCLFVCFNPTNMQVSKLQQC